MNEPKVPASHKTTRDNITDAVTGAINTCIIQKQSSGKPIRYICMVAMPIMIVCLNWISKVFTSWMDG